MASAAVKSYVVYGTNTECYYQPLETNTEAVKYLQEYRKYEAVHSYTCCDFTECDIKRTDHYVPAEKAIASKFACAMSAAAICSSLQS